VAERGTNNTNSHLTGHWWRHSYLFDHQWLTGFSRNRGCNFATKRNSENAVMLMKSESNNFWEVKIKKWREDERPLHRIGFPSVVEAGDEAWLLLSSIANCGKRKKMNTHLLFLYRCIYPRTWSATLLLGSQKWHKNTNAELYIYLVL